jgi:hypothetical protein
MDADKNGIALAVGDCATLPQSDEIIAGTCHDRSKSGGLELALQSLGDIECVDFLAQPLVWNSAAIMSAVPGINDDRPRGQRRAGKSGADGQDQQDSTEDIHQIGWKRFGKTKTKPAQIVPVVAAADGGAPRGMLS